MIISTIEQMVEVAELQDIQCMEERGRRITWTEEELQTRSLPEIENSMGIEVAPGRLNYRVRLRYTDVTAEYVADWVATIHLGDNVVESDPAHEYGDRVAFFALYPYIRASIYGSASRLNQPVPVLGIVRQGQFERGEALTPEESNERFNDNRAEA